MKKIRPSQRYILPRLEVFLHLITTGQIRRTMSMGYVNHDDSSELSDINSENSDDSSELSELEDQELPDNGGEGLCEQKEQNLLPDVGSSSGLSDLTDVSSDWATYGSRHPPVDDSDDNTHLGELSCSSGGDAALAKGSGQMLRREEISSLSSPLSLQPDTEELTMRVGNTQHGLSGSTKGTCTPPAA